MRASTALTRARRSHAALALNPLPASEVQSDPPEIAELDTHNYEMQPNDHPEEYPKRQRV